MLIVCPNCATSYRVDLDKLGPQGRPVRCARCQGTWFAQASPAAAAATAPAGSPRSGMEGNGEAAAPGAQAEARQPSAAGDAILEPSASGPAPAEAAPGRAPEDIETAAARRARLSREARTGRRHRALLPIAIFVLVAILAGLVGWRAEVVRIAPQTAQLYGLIGLPVNLRGLVFEDVKVAEEMQDGVPLLVVQGRIVNATQRTVEVPRLRFALRDPAGVEVYAWTAVPDRPVLNPAEALPFRSRLASPPANVKDVLVRFFHRRDLVAAR